MIQRIGNFLAAGAALAMIPAATFAQAPAKSPYALPHDDKMTCPQILAEAEARGSDFDTTLEKRANLKVKNSARTNALLAASEAISTAAPLLSPVADPLSTAAVIGASGAYMESSRADERKAAAPLDKKIDFSIERADYLYELYQTKCHRTPSAKQLNSSATMPISNPSAAGPAPGPAPKGPGGPASAPASSSAAAGPRGPGATGDASSCTVLAAERDRARREVELGTAQINSEAMAYNPGKGMVGATVAGQAASAAASMIPVIGGLVGSAASAVSGAARQAQSSAFQSKMMEMAQKQTELSQRLIDIETAYEEKCMR